MTTIRACLIFIIVAEQHQCICLWRVGHGFRSKLLGVSLRHFLICSNALCGQNLRPNVHALLLAIIAILLINCYHQNSMTKPLPGTQDLPLRLFNACELSCCCPIVINIFIANIDVEPAPLVYWSKRCCMRSLTFVRVHAQPATHYYAQNFSIYITTILKNSFKWQR